MQALNIMKISSNFDSGNIELLSCNDPQNIQLRIPEDTQAEFFQWFHFRLQGAKGEGCRIRLMNASEASYAEGWDNYNAVASYDRINWFRVPCYYNGKELVIEHTPEHNSVYYSYFAPFSYEQHQNMVQQAQLSNHCELVNIGETVEGRDMDLLIIGEPDDNKKNIWIIARQHPGESMAEWFMQGLINRLLNENDSVSSKLLEKASFFLVPNMNIDGSIHGNLRANAAGSNLNREWANPSIEKSPEVFHVRQFMDEWGCDLNLDIHGDEALPYNFISGIEGIPSFDERLQKLTDTFINSWLMASPDFQNQHTYPKNEPGKANLNICSKHIGERFKCLSLTIEMPFKDNDDMPDAQYGWSPSRAQLFGESVLHPILQVVDSLR